MMLVYSTWRRAIMQKDGAARQAMSWHSNVTLPEPRRGHLLSGGAQQGARDKECHQSGILEATWCPYTACLSPHWSPPTQKAKKSSNAASLRAAQKYLLETPERALREHRMPKQGCLLFLLRISVRKEINICSGFLEAKIWNYGCAEANTPGYVLGRKEPALVFIDLCQKLSRVYFRSFQAWISRSLLSSMCHTGYWGCGNYPRGINSWHWGCKTLRAPVHSNSFGRAALICRHQTSRSVVRINPLKTQTGLLCQWSKKWNVWGSISYAYTHIFRNQHIPFSITAILFFFNTRYHTVLPVFYWGINVISHTEIHGNHKVKDSKMPTSSFEL